jgi:predicted phosphodiesterase
MIFITGDTHGGQQDGYKKLVDNYSNLSSDDYIIVLGDFGYSFFHPGMKEYTNFAVWVKWLSEQPWTTLFIDGNHENFEALAQIPEVDMFGAKVGKVSDKLFYLKRGYVYTIDGLKFFTFGGARSKDRNNRTMGVDWFREEEPSFMDYRRGQDNLIQYDEVDYILTHECGSELFEHLTSEEAYNLPKFIQVILDGVRYKQHFFGHHHRDETFGKSRCLYRDVIRIL